MPLDVTSWFVDQLSEPATEPVRKFTIGGSDYSDRVTRWPRFKRTANELKSVKTTVNLANHDGGLNYFYETQYTLTNSCLIQFGFTHATSGEELVDLFVGEIEDVRYTKDTCQLRMRDRLWRFADRVVGDTDNPVVIPPSSQELPSDIAWTLCTCYGALSDVESTSNPDIDYSSFLTWADVFSTDNVFAQTNFEGEKVLEGLEEIGRMTDSAIWIEGDGKLYFKRFTTADSNDAVITLDDMGSIIIDLEKSRLINRQWVYWDYAVESEYWQSKVYSERDTSVNTFGVKEDVLKSENIWYVTSVSALNLAQRRSYMLQYPPRRFNAQTAGKGAWMQLGETIRLVNSFYDLSSGQGWRFVEQDIDLHRMVFNFELDAAAIMDAFYLDISTLDGTHVLA